MVALDTNILVRSALDDDSSLRAHAQRLIMRNQCWVSILTIAETGYTLMSFYGVKLPALIASCRSLIGLPNVECEHEQRVLLALDGVEAGIDWFDALLWASAPSTCTLVTYDKAFAKRASVLGWKVECRLPKVGK